MVGVVRDEGVLVLDAQSPHLSSCMKILLRASIDA